MILNPCVQLTQSPDGLYSLACLRCHFTAHFPAGTTLQTALHAGTDHMRVHVLMAQLHQRRN